MKKRLVILLAGLLTVLSMGFGSAQFSDVPAGHWAKEAVEAIAAQGLIVGFPDGTFRGNENLTRYQAALIIYRLLQQLQGQQGQPAPKIDEETLNTIRNAVQELAAELAALGVRVSALEDNAASKDDIARLEAAIEELKGMKAQPGQGMDQQALSDLADRVEAASVAADTALAQAQQLADRLDAVEGDVATVKTQLEADADSIRALNELSVLLNQDVLSLQDRVTALEKSVGTLSETDFNEFATKEDVAAVQEFATALRGDLVRLSDRVSTLSTTVDGINNRLTAVEGTRPSLTGSILARYGYRFVTKLSGTGPGNFDVDRLFPATGFGADDDAEDLPNSATLGAGIDTRLQADLTFSLKRAATTTSGFNFTEATAALRWRSPNGSLWSRDGTDNDLRLERFTVKGNIDGQDFSIGYARVLTYKFNDYFFEDNGSGYRGASISFNASKAFLSPNITVVLGSSASAVGTSPDAGSGDNDFFGIRTAVNLLGLNASFNYAERNVLNSGNAPSYAGFGTDYKGKLFGLLDIDGGYFLSKSNANAAINFATDPQVFYTTAGVSLGPVSLRGNYRAIDPRFDSSGANAGLLNNNDGQPFAFDNRGFGVLGGVNLGFLSVNGYYDSFTNFALANPQTAFGVGASANLFAGFSLTGYFNNTSNVGGQVRSGNNPYGANGPETRAAFGSNFGVRLAHDGSADNALIKGLDLFAEYRQSQGTDVGFGSNGSRTDIAAGASFALNLGFLSITPDVRYHSYTAATSTPGTEDSYSTLKYGVQVSTQTLNLGFIKPSLSGDFASRSTDFAINNDASETRFGVGLSLADFLLPGATLSAKAAQVQGTNVNTTTTRSCNAAFDIGTDCLYSTPGTDFGPIAPAAPSAFTLKGLFLSYTYAGAGIWYGVFDFDNGSDGTVDSVGRGFRIFYNVSF
ncbi:S-layer domain protein [Allomeiothermus silvanus DSM 9946]|uniref:S-layer domain protein n=1 Tax=Allomeiothermus silvanus (strain ATCC 700542 / DSM 9946 / NBRC 106475 / NCIMB 13440 / VI-R2) TaxID=526227 RepID=D7BGP8_ALLS1|nr:S-layer homology domain-containing protein [Allomeiothermus silvanus]ADH62052.1 S-layer domain protein [Allomeiothermus silvanus DSM 9946]